MSDDARLINQPDPHYTESTRKDVPQGEGPAPWAQPERLPGDGYPLEPDPAPDVFSYGKSDQATPDERATRFGIALPAAMATLPDDKLRLCLAVQDEVSDVSSGLGWMGAALAVTKFSTGQMWFVFDDVRNEPPAWIPSRIVTLWKRWKNAQLREAINPKPSSLQADEKALMSRMSRTTLLTGLPRLFFGIEQLVASDTSCGWSSQTSALLRYSTGECWFPGLGQPPSWVPADVLALWAEWKATQETQDTGAVPPAFDEPEGECRKSAESAAKPRWELLPWDAVEEVVEILTFGAKKYEDNNWARGARWGRYMRAAISHITQWWRGEDLDPETGKSHLAHAVCCIIFLMEYQRNGWGRDDRFRGPDNAPFVKHDGHE